MKAASAAVMTLFLSGCGDQNIAGTIYQFKEACSGHVTLSELTVTETKTEYHAICEREKLP